MPNFQGHKIIREASRLDYRTRCSQLLALQKLVIVKV